MLTAPQLKVLRFIADRIKTSGGVSPSYGEIVAHMGWGSKSRASDVIGQLVERKWIRRTARRSRSIEIIRPLPEITASPWSSVNTLPDSDDLVWLYNIGSRSIDGPRPPAGDDVDRFDYWAPCEAPEPYPTADKGSAR